MTAVRWWESDINAHLCYPFAASRNSLPLFLTFDYGLPPVVIDRKCEFPVTFNGQYVWMFAENTSESVMSGYYLEEELEFIRRTLRELLESQP